MRHGVAKDFLKGSRRNHRGHAPYPFDRFLTSRLGRVWDEVYSEICAEFDSRSYAGERFLHDLDWHVSKNCWVGADTGTIYCSGYRGYSPVSNEFYVHPWTGLLCWADAIVREYPARPVTHIKIDGDNYLEQVDGIWYCFHTDHVPDKDYYGRPVTRDIVLKTQISRKELRARGIANGPPPYKGHCAVCGFDGNCVHRIREEAEAKAKGGRWWPYGAV